MSSGCATQRSLSSDFGLPPRPDLLVKSSRFAVRTSQLFCVALLLWRSAFAALDFSAQHARFSPDWLREGVIYEIFPRNFSAQGNFNGITARLDELKELGVNILWLMPIHPVGEKMKKGTLGSPYAVRDFYAINRDYGTEADLKRLVSETH